MVQKDDETIESIVYTIKEPLRFAGAWENKQLLQGITPDSLELRSGCSILIKKKGAGEFEGSTNGKDCPSNLREASYAKSEVVINQKQLVSWDRGFDSSDKQVWGAEKGGYVFEKLKE
ncbi:MAG: chromophore lyase CpcT/CpeT [Bacteroidetes bacterium]|nr:chromophore lyase CpcT/CpeT [Bacteroidota bacterium]